MVKHYQIRKAAGLYWIIPTNQLDTEYIPPLPVNECGTIVFQKLQEKMEKDQIIKYLVELYGITEQEAKDAIDSFCSQLKEHGIVL